MADITFEESIAQMKSRIAEKLKSLDDCVENIVALGEGGSLSVQFILKGNDYVWEEMVVGAISADKWVLLVPPDHCPLPKNQVMDPDMVLVVLEHMISLTKPWSTKKSTESSVVLNFTKIPPC